MMHRYQIELTTRCNFDCWYCTGRAMPQADMPWDQFKAIVDQIPVGQTVMLQGEGEPTLWPDWWRGVEYTHSRGLVPYSIMNGSRVDVVRTAILFPRIGVSIDTLDPKEAENIGRHNLKKVLENVEQLNRAMPNRVLIHITRAQTGVEDVVRWAIERDMGYVIQPLQVKDDYQVVYPMWLRHRHPDTDTVASENALECKYLVADNHYWTVDGLDLPCCYIKADAQTFNRYAASQEMAAGITPRHCTNCRNLCKTNHGRNEASNPWTPHSHA